MRGVTIEDVLALERISAPALSPAGDLIAAAVGREDVAANRKGSRICIFDADGRAPARDLTNGVNLDQHPCWRLDGRWVAFSSKRPESEHPQICAADIETGEVRSLTDIPDGALAPKWSPCGKAIYFLAWIPEAPGDAGKSARRPDVSVPLSSAMTWDKGPVSFWDHYLPPRRLALHAVDFHTGAVRSLMGDSDIGVEFRLPAANAFAVAPGGDEIAFAAQTDVTGLRPHTKLHALSLASGEVCAISAAIAGWEHSPAYSADGRHLAWLAGRLYGAPECELVMVAERTQSGAPRTPRALGADWDRHARAIAWDGDSILCVAEDRPTRRVFRIALEGGAPQPITEAGDFSDLSAVKGRVFALRSSFSEPHTLVEIEPFAAHQSKRSSLNDQRLSEIQFGAVECVNFSGARNDPVQMWVIKPPDFDPSRRHPLLLLLHGGPFFGVTDEWHYNWTAQAFAAWGYVAAWLNFHGSSGFGAGFAQSIAHDLTTLPYEDTIAAARWFAEKPWIDQDRMAAMGGSFGGFLACTLLGRPHPFKALVNHAGVYDQYTQSAADYAISPFSVLSFDDHQHLQDNSPHMRDAHFDTPMLILHGLKDLRVPASQSIELFQALQRRGTPARLVLYPDEHHHILLPQNLMHWHASMRAWVEHHAPPGGR